MVSEDFNPRDYSSLTQAIGTVILFTVICLAMAGHFQSVLAASDLSAYLHPSV